MSKFKTKFNPLTGELYEVADVDAAIAALSGVEEDKLTSIGLLADELDTSPNLITDIINANIGTDNNLTDARATALDDLISGNADLTVSGITDTGTLSVDGFSAFYDTVTVQPGADFRSFGNAFFSGPTFYNSTAQFNNKATFKDDVTVDGIIASDNTITIEGTTGLLLLSQDGIGMTATEGALLRSLNSDFTVIADNGSVKLFSDAARVELDSLTNNVTIDGSRLDLSSTNEVRINTSAGNEDHTFEFTSDGTFYLAKNSFSNVSYVNTPRNDTSASMTIASAQNVNIVSGDLSSEIKSWSFETDGSIEFPDGTFQDTAFTPTLSGVTLKGYTETVDDLGADITNGELDLSDGNIKVIDDSDFVFSGFQNATEGMSVTLLMTETASATGIFDHSTSAGITVKFNGGNNDLDAGGDNIVHIVYLNSVYYVTISKGYF